MNRSLAHSFQTAALAMLCSICIIPGHAAEAPAAKAAPILILVIDGLRPDYVTPERMPNLHALGERGVVGEAHHSVYPTMTRVNAPSIATGAYPGRHGQMHNSAYFPDISSRPLDTGNATALMRVEQETGGNLLSVPSLGELLAKAGKKYFVAGSSSTGTSFLLNHKIAGSIFNSRGFVRPVELEEKAVQLLGPFPPDAKPNRQRNRWGIDAYLEIGLKEIQPDVALIWLNDPDGTAHKNGIGNPATISALEHIDEELGRLFDTLKSRGVLERLNIFVTTDHGFSTHLGLFNLTKLLIDHNLHDDVTVVANQVFVKDSDTKKIEQIVRVLQKTEAVGAIFTRAQKPGSHEGIITGTLSFDSIHWNHARAADILVDANWNSDKNEFGFAGTTTQGGVAGHGTSSPHDIGIRLFAAGPDIKRSVRSNVPTSNIDIAPTALHLHGIEIPSSMNGRAMKELLRNGPSPDAMQRHERTLRAAFAGSDVNYSVMLKQVRVEQTEYFSFTKTERGQGGRGK